MGTSSKLAKCLDENMLQEAHGVLIAPSHVLDEDLPEKTGTRVAGEIGGRYLMRYVLPNQLQALSDGSSRLQYVTCTPYAPEEVAGQLALPRATEPRSHVFVLQPSKLRKVFGPRWVKGGYGIEYLLPDGFEKDALVVPWAVRVE